MVFAESKQYIGRCSKETLHYSTVKYKYINNIKIELINGNFYNVTMLYRSV